MKPFDIYDATFPFKGCEDRRPWLVIDGRADEIFGCFPISGVHYEGPCFALDSGHPDFAAAGLKKSCYILDERIYELHVSHFQRCRGQLSGDLLTSFRDYAGV